MVCPTAADAICADCTRELARLLKLLAHPHRLAVLCHLARHGESRAGVLAEMLVQLAARDGAVAPSQSALSQHLALLRAEGLVAARREVHAVWYRLADPRVERLLGALGRLPCPYEMGPYETAPHARAPSGIKPAGAGPFRPATKACKEMRG